MKCLEMSDREVKLLVRDFDKLWRALKEDKKVIRENFQALNLLYDELDEWNEL